MAAHIGVSPSHLPMIICEGHVATPTAWCSECAEAGFLGQEPGLSALRTRHAPAAQLCSEGTMRWNSSGVIAPLLSSSRAFASCWSSVWAATERM